MLDLTLERTKELFNVCMSKVDQALEQYPEKRQDYIDLLSNMAVYLYYFFVELEYAVFFVRKDNGQEEIKQ